MRFELYEVWARHDDGYEELIVTTKDLHEAKKEAKLALEDEGIDECVIFQETEDGDTVEISTMHR